MTTPDETARKLDNQAPHLTYYPHWLDNLADDVILQGAVFNGELRQTVGLSGRPGRRRETACKSGDPGGGVGAPEMSLGSLYVPYAYPRVLMVVRGCSSPGRTG